MYIVGNGQGSPCLDLRRVPDTLADATVGADLVRFACNPLAGACDYPGVAAANHVLAE